MPSNLYNRMKIRKHTKKTKYTRSKRGSKKKHSRNSRRRHASKRTIHKNKKTRNLKRKNQHNGGGSRTMGWNAPSQSRLPTERERMITPIERLIRIGYVPDDARVYLDGVPPENVEAVVAKAERIERLLKMGYGFWELDGVPPENEAEVVAKAERIERLIKIGYSPYDARGYLDGVLPENEEAVVAMAEMRHNDPKQMEKEREIEKQVGRDKLARRGRAAPSAAQKMLITYKLMEAGLTHKDAERVQEHVPRGKVTEVVRSLLKPGPIERLIKIGYAPDNARRYLEGVPPENVEAAVEEAILQRKDMKQMAKDTDAAVTALAKSTAARRYARLLPLIKAGFTEEDASSALAGVEDKDYVDAIIRLTGRHPKDILEGRPGSVHVLGNPGGREDSWGSFVVG